MTTSNKTPVATAIVSKLSTSMLSADTRKLGADWVSGLVKTGNLKTRFVDSAYADGVRSDDCTAPEKGADRTLYEDLKSVMVAGFPAAARSMVIVSAEIAKSYKSIGEDEAKQNRLTACKENRKYWQQQIGSKLKDLKAALVSLEKAEAESLKTDDERDAEAKEALKQASDAARLLKDVSAWINRLEKTEGTTLPVVECLGHFKALSAIATKYMPA